MKKGRLFHFVKAGLSSLALSIEAPAIGLPGFCNDKGVVSPCVCGYDLATNAVEKIRLLQYARSAVFIINDIRRRHIFKSNSKCLIIDATPYQTLATLSNGYAVILSTEYGDKPGMLSKATNLSGERHNCIVLTSAYRNGSLPKVI